MKALLTILRNRKTSAGEFRVATRAVADLLAIEAWQHLSKVKTVVTRRVILVPILRSGLALLPSFIEKFPDARVGFIGLKRNEKTLKPKMYYKNLPKINKTDKVIVLDPMLATGGSAVAGVKALIEAGALEKNMMFVGVISAPAGLTKLQTNFPLISVHVAAHDEKLDKNGYIVPGLGDFGDRYFSG